MGRHLKFDANFRIGSPNHFTPMDWKSACRHADCNSVRNVFRRFNCDPCAANRNVQDEAFTERATNVYLGRDMHLLTGLTPLLAAKLLLVFPGCKHPSGRSDDSSGVDDSFELCSALQAFSRLRLKLGADGWIRRIERALGEALIHFVFVRGGGHHGASFRQSLIEEGLKHFHTYKPLGREQHGPERTDANVRAAKGESNYNVWNLI